MSDIVLSTRDIAVSFGGVRAADGVNAEVYRGEFLAIIGPNGSGKTTFLNLCTGYVKPDAGRVIFEGRDITGLSPRRITRRGIARAFQIPQMFTDHTLIENVLIAVAARNGFWDWYTPLDRLSYRTTATDILDLVGLADVGDQTVVELPEGMRKLADIALALALKPTLLLLDEPTSGLDPLMERVFTDCLRDERRRGRTVLLSSHILSEVEALCDHVSIIRAGRLVESGTLAQLRHLTRTQLVAQLRDDPPAAALAALTGVPGVHDAHVDGGRLTCQVDDAALTAALGALAALGVRSLVSSPPTLEELFLRHYDESPSPATAAS